MADKRYSEETSVRPSLVPPPLAGVLSLVVPGLGQILARQARRGVLLLVCLVSSVGLLAWRMSLAARREVGALNILRKAISLQPLLAAMTVGVVLLWLWIAWDGYQQARPERRAGAGIFLLVIHFLCPGLADHRDQHRQTGQGFRRCPAGVEQGALAVG